MIVRSLFLIAASLWLVACGEADSEESNQCYRGTENNESPCLLLKGDN